MAYEKLLNEIYAVISLKYLWPEYQNGFFKSESPDWLNEEMGMGMEVSQALLPDDGQAESVIEKYLGCEKHELPESALQRYGDRLHFYNNRFWAILPESGHESRWLFKAKTRFDEKLKKLNTNYALQNINSLYLFLHPQAGENVDISELFEYMKQSQCGEHYRFDLVFLNSNDEIHVCDFQENTVQRIEVPVHAREFLDAESERLRQSGSWPDGTVVDKIPSKYGRKTVESRCKRRDDGVKDISSCETRDPAFGVNAAEEDRRKNVRTDDRRAFCEDMPDAENGRSGREIVSDIEDKRSRKKDRSFGKCAVKDKELTRMEQQLDFILELDKQKKINRQTFLSDGSRRENDAEHAWHLAVMTLVLSEYANEPVDVLHTMAMALLHDVVEIDAGDTYAYDEKGKATQAEREMKAAERIYHILPPDQAETLFDLWREFEERRTPEARFARVMDNIQPILLNVASGGIGWMEKNVRLDQVLGRNSISPEGSQKLWEYIFNERLKPSVEKGWLKPSRADISDPDEEKK